MRSLKILVVLAWCYVAVADYRQDGLNKHNEFRAIHDASAMTLDDDMNTAAEEYAQTLFELGYLKHSDRDSRPEQGENLAMGCSTGSEGRSVQDAVKSWYDEVCQYDFDNPGYSSAVGHFTQVVWKGSTELGIGKYTGQDGDWTCTYIVARYKPTGNINTAQYFSDNVKKGSFSSSYCDTVGDQSVGKAEYLDAPEGSTN
ncbi:hypothetical protein ACROYT_G039492 [Oculina patagonica]